uniref:Peptidase A1 domain-containing protein n=1 Tax=Trichuris muris TaxID=70415 RepID=A0A5S6QLI0_TRIMR
MKSSFVTVLLSFYTAWTNAQNCGGVPTQNLVTLSRVFNFATTDNRLVDSTIATTLQGQGFINLGSIGKILSQNDSSVCGFLHPVRALYSNPLSTTYYIMNDLLYAQRQADGYIPQGTLGWAVPGVGMCGATQKIYELFKVPEGIIQAPESMVSQYLSAGYTYQGVSFAIWPTS